VARPAEVTLPAEMSVRFRDNPVTGPESLNCRTNFFDNPGKLMAHHYRRPIGKLVPINMNIRAAYPGGADFDEYFVVMLYYRNRQFPYFYIACALGGFYQSFHHLPFHSKNILYIESIYETATSKKLYVFWTSPVFCLKHYICALAAYFTRDLFRTGVPSSFL
jgi:hypothetical protein